jgi:hypothetical protein
MLNLNITKNFGIKSLCAVVCFLCMAFFNSVSAKIEITVERNYTVTPQMEMQVEEVHSIFNNTENLFIPAGEEIQFEILGFKTEDPNEKQNLEAALASAKLKKNNTYVSFNHEFGENKVIIKTRYSGNFYPGAQINFILTYKHPALIYRNGALSEAYIHAFGKDFKFELPNTTYTFNTKLKIPKQFENNYQLFPDPANTSTTDSEIVFEYDQDKLVNQYVYMQLGKTQYYEFELNQEILPTENKHTGLKNRYELIIPRNFKNGTVEQKVYIKSIKPEPEYIKYDNQNNVIGVFDFYTDITDKITVIGYAELKIDSTDFKSKVGEIKDIPRDIVNKYTKPAEYWEVNEPEIIKSAESIPAYENNVYEFTSSAYKFVVDSIDYSQVKKFGLNERKGALATLNGGAAVCMEYSDLFLTLMRARKVPARAVFGYGYDPQKAKEQQEAHQWVQIYMPGLEYNWVDVDVTWGEGGTTLIGGDLSHFYTHFAYEDPNTPNVVSRDSFGLSTEDNLKAPKLTIAAVEKLDESVQLKSLEEVIKSYESNQESEVKQNILQFVNRYKAGFVGLIESPDLNNSSQLMAFSTVFLFSVIFFYVLAPLYSLRKKTN